MSFALSQSATAACAAWLAASLCSPLAVAEADSFSYTGGEQTYVVPAGVSNVRITAIGASGGSPPAGAGLPGGRGAVVVGIAAVTPGQVLYVSVGGAGGQPAGGFNGGGDGGTRAGDMAWGGGGASDVSSLPDSAGAASLQSRLIVAAGGGGSAGPAAGGGDAGAPGGCCGAAGTGPDTAQPGSQTAGGAGGGCAVLIDGCGSGGSLGEGGDGGVSGIGPDVRTGGGGGGGLYGGGGGAGHVTDSGGGAGGSSLVPAGGTIAVATTPARIDIEPYVPPPATPARGCADGTDNDRDGLTDFPADLGCSSATDDDETGGAPVDRVAPTAKLTGRTRQKLGRSVAVAFRCGSAENCRVSATGRLSIAGRTYGLRPVKRRTVARGTATTLKLRLPAKAPAAARRALRRQQRVQATVTVTVADAAGNTTTLKRTIRLVR